MRTIAFADRNLKEMIRDKLNIIFALGFPIVILLLLSLIQSNIPVDLFEINKLAPGIVVFGLSFISLFSGVLIAKDRSTSLMMRLFTSPLEAKDFILGYTIPLVPLAIGQSITCYIVAYFLGLKLTINILLTVVATIPAAILFIAIGLLCGTIFNDKQVGGVCGALLTNLTAWLSGTWFDYELVGGVFKKIAEALPFSHAVNAGRYALAGQYSKIFPDLWWVIAYALIMLIISILVFTYKMKESK